MKNDLGEIISILDALHIPYRMHSWTTMPQDHVFATWFVPEEEFDGHDLRAEYFRYTVEVYLYFRKYTNGDDQELMESFEQECRGAGHYLKRSGYDNDKDLFWARYEFEFTELFNT